MNVCWVITPTSTIAVNTLGAPATTTLSYAATTNTTVQAQASSTTGAVPHGLANHSHFAWLPASKRPHAPLVLNPADPLPTLTEPKRGKKAATATPPANVVQPNSSAKPKPKPKLKKAVKPVPDPEPTELSKAESIVLEPAPPKKTRKKSAATTKEVTEPVSLDLVHVCVVNSLLFVRTSQSQVVQRGRQKQWWLVLQ